MESKRARIKPRIIIHGGAGNITRDNLSRQAYAEYRKAMLEILHKADSMLQSDASAVDAASYAVSLLELNPFFNAGHGAVYTTAGTHELEASIMVSSGFRKRGVGVMNVRTTKSPILLAKEMLVRGESDNGGGAQGHCQLQGDVCDRLAADWGLETVQPSYFWTRKRWDEHRRGLGLSHSDDEYRQAKADADRTDRGASISQASLAEDMTAAELQWDGREYLPQGTVGAVALDSLGVLCVCTSTGGLTNKLPGRIGDTPTIGAGFFAEEWLSFAHLASAEAPQPEPSPLNVLVDCLPIFSQFMRQDQPTMSGVDAQQARAVAMSGTGNGDSFLRLSAVRTAAAMMRFSEIAHPQMPSRSLQEAVTAVAGPNGSLQRSAEDRWRKTGEGEGGIIGIELVRGKGIVVDDFNCGGMFRAWVEEDGSPKFLAFREDY